MLIIINILRRDEQDEFKDNPENYFPNEVS